MTNNERHRLRFHAWLVAAGLDEETADAILMGMAPFPWHELATKADVAGLRTEIGGLRIEMRDQFGDIRGEMAGMRTEMRNEFGDIRTEMRDQFGDIRTEMAGMRTDIRDQFGDIRTEMAGIRTDVRTMVFALVGFILTILLAGAATAISLAV